MGGMAAFIHSRKDPEVNKLAMEKVREDKEREAGDGFDGTWVAHPDLVEVATECFDAVLGERPNQIDKQRPHVHVEGRQLVEVKVPGGRITEEGLRLNVSVGIQYLESWLRGNGAAAINNLMEDAATAEISRSQVWQWVHHRARLDDGRTVGKAMVEALEDEEMEKLRKAYGPELWAKGRFDDARAIFEEVALADQFIDFLTVPAYERLG